jgi:hypothetical protein
MLTVYVSLSLHALVLPISNSRTGDVQRNNPMTDRFSNASEKGNNKARAGYKEVHDEAQAVR